jgi:hypothetical protein
VSVVFRRFERGLRRLGSGFPMRDLGSKGVVEFAEFGYPLVSVE